MWQKLRRRSKIDLVTRGCLTWGCGSLSLTCCANQLRNKDLRIRKRWWPQSWDS